MTFSVIEICSQRQPTVDVLRIKPVIQADCPMFVANAHLLPTGVGCVS